jgi:outer membrane protein insertion porin family/translocation and assembly module TamA
MLQHMLNLGRRCFGRLAGLLILSSLVGCGSDLQGRTVSDVTLVESSPSEVDTDQALEKLATGKPRTFLGFERERDTYDPNLVARDVERVERFYRAHGYYDVKVTAARVREVDERQVAVDLRVTPGPRAVVRKVTDDPRVLNLPGDIQLKLKALPELRPGTPFEESLLDVRERDIARVLTEAGYAYAKVRVVASVDLSSRAVDVTSEVDAGSPCRFGEVSFVGLRQIPEWVVRPALGFKQGARYSQADQDDARDALGAMQVFSRVEITPDLSNPAVTDVPVLVTVQEDKLRNLTLGGGTVIDSLKLEAHVRSGWEHKNFLGGARRFAIEGVTGLVFYPTRFETFETLTKVTNVFLTLEATATLEQPAIFKGRTRGSVQVGYSRRPVLYSLPEGTDPALEPVIGYHTPSGKLALMRHFLRQRMYIEPSYNLLARIPFAYQNEIPSTLETVWVSYPRLYGIVQSYPGDIFKDRSRRDLTLSLRNSIEVAGLSVNGTRYLGGSISDIKLEPEVRMVMPLWGKRWQDRQKVGNLTLGTRVKFGFILNPDYGSTLQGDPSTLDYDDPAVLSDQQKLLTRAFYSGGPTSNRGYSYRAISPHGPVGFLVPTRVDCTDPIYKNEDVCVRPLGGFSLWEASLELRWSGFFPLTLVAFADASDVDRDVAGFSLLYPHISVGPGLRYETPVGPIRIDIGIRVPGLQAIGQDTLPVSHGREEPTGLIPGAFHVAFGDAF